MFDWNGCHLMIDARSDSDKLSDANEIVKFLENLVVRIDMTMILPPITVKFPHSISEMNRILISLQSEGLGDSETAEKIATDIDCREKQMYGYSSFVMIAESHISIHTFPEFGYFSFDCYSCKKFDHGKVIDALADFFETEKIVVQMNERKIP
jgi:S-adenosylmethionine decarboxylase